VAKKSLRKEEREALIETLKARFEANMQRHKGIDWPKVAARLEADPDMLWSLSEMERTGGEPDVVGHDRKSGEYTFFDCAAESPKGRRSLCYDPAALKSRKQNKPKGSAVGMASDMGQELGEFDTKTSSWLETPTDIRELGGAIFGDFRYGNVFVYHNGAESYYAARGFRCVLRV